MAVSHGDLVLPGGLGLPGTPCCRPSAPWGLFQPHGAESLEGPAPMPPLPQVCTVPGKPRVCSQRGPVTVPCTQLCSVCESLGAAPGPPCVRSAEEPLGPAGRVGCPRPGHQGGGSLRGRPAVPRGALALCLPCSDRPSTSLPMAVLVACLPGVEAGPHQQRGRPRASGISEVTGRATAGHSRAAPQTQGQNQPTEAEQNQNPGPWNLREEGAS